MTEFINPTDHSTAAIFLINAMTREVPRGELLEHFKIKDGNPVKVEVELKINGVPVAFTQSINEMWGRLNSTYEADVKAKALELVELTSINEIEDVLQNTVKALRAQLGSIVGGLNED